MIETDRLILRPLTYSQLLKYVSCDNSLEEEFGLLPSDRTISKELKEALENTILPHVADETRNYLYSTIWTAISKSEQTMIGDVCFVGEPNELGEIEIGYGTYESFQGQGYMTEVVAGMMAWGRQQLEIKAIVASTEKTNFASFRVLEKNGFEKISESADFFNWRCELR